MLSGAAAAIAASFMPSLDFRNREVPKPGITPMPTGHSFRHKNPPAPRGGTNQQFSGERLILDRVSSVRKIQRWHRAGRMMMPEAKPGTKAHDRHRERRAEAQRAKNLESLRST